MSDSNRKKKSPAILFSVVFLVIVVLMFVAHSRSILEAELRAPSGGVKKLYTVSDWLVAISQTSEIYIWDWNQIVDKPRTGHVRADNVVWLPIDRCVWTPSYDLGTIVISDLKGDREYKRLSPLDLWIKLK